jgi:thiol-disulfide isomerase/thioredoxin
MKNFFTFIILSMGLTASAHAQEPISFTLVGEIANAQTSKVHSSTILRCHAQSGCPKYLLNENHFESYFQYNRDILIDRDGAQFRLPDFILKGDQMNVFFFDALGRMAKVHVTRDLIQDAMVDAGSIVLQETVPVSGQVRSSFADTTLDLSQMTIMVSEVKAKGALLLTAVSQATANNQFHLNLLPGRYTIFFDAPDTSDRWLRTIETIDVEAQPIHIEEVSFETPMDALMEQKASLSQVLKDFNKHQLTPDQIQVYEQILQAEGKTLVYFTAGYCGPCLGKDGLAHYINLAHASNADFSVLGIHSDSYGVLKNCPQSQDEMEDYLDHRETWTHIAKSYQKAKQAQAPVLLAYQAPSLAKNLEIVGYPTMLVFQDGKLQDWFTGSSDETKELLEKLLQP